MLSVTPALSRESALPYASNIFQAPSALWPWAFFGGEAFVIAYEVWGLLVLIRFTDHSPQADAYERELRRRPGLPTVDVFIPTFSEGPDILAETLRAALNTLAEVAPEWLRSFAPDEWYERYAHRIEEYRRALWEREAYSRG